MWTRLAATDLPASRWSPDSLLGRSSQVLPAIDMPGLAGDVGRAI